MSMRMTVRMRMTVVRLRMTVRLGDAMCRGVDSLPAPLRLPPPLLRLLLEHPDLGELEAEPRAEDAH